jgi:branched-chain amino acid transport system permease protein
MGFVATAALGFCFPDYQVFRFAEAAIWAIALLGLVVLCGIGGQFSFAQAAFYGIGGYAAALLGTHTPLSPYCSLLLVPLLGYGAGYGLGRIASGHSIWTQALVSYALVVAFPQLLRWRPIEQWTGGVQGLYLDPLPAPAGLVSEDRWLFLVALVLLGGSLALTANLIDSRFGRALRATRDHDMAAEAQGIAVVQVRSRASGLAGAFIAVAGCLSAFQFGFVGPTAYTFQLSMQMLFGAVIGGLYSLAGPIVGGVFLEFFPGVTASLGKGLSALLYAALLIAAIVAMPDGLAGGMKRLASRLDFRRP